MAAFTRLAVLALSGMTGRIFRRKELRTSTSPSTKGARPTATTGAIAATAAPSAAQSSAGPAPTGAASPPVDYFQHLSPHAKTPILASVAAKSLPLLGLLGTAVTLALGLGAVRGELPYLGPIESASPAWAAALVTISLWAVYLLWKVPQWQAAAWARSGNPNPRELFEIENDSRGTLGQILSGVAVLTGLIFAWQQLGQTSDNLRVSQEGQITDRFSRAVDQLGSDQLTIRLGGIYALERIARDSPRDYGPVMEVLTAFAREQSPLPKDAAATPVTAATRVPPDVRAVFKVIGRRTPAQVKTELDEGSGCLDLTGINAVGVDLVDANLQNTCWNRSDLRGAQMMGASLIGSSFEQADLSQQASLGGADAHGASFANANLSFSDLTRTDLSGADLLGANLSGTILQETNLENANLTGANLQEAQLIATDLEGANVFNANLTKALITGAKMATTKHLTASQLAKAGFVDQVTTLPNGVRATPVP
jgi:uncharacterized protein YjbI with pentapeptide repeats